MSALGSLLLEDSALPHDGSYLALGLAGTVLVMVALFLWQWQGERLRRRLFVGRPLLDEDQWFATYYPGCPENDRPLILRFLRSFAEEIGVHWSQLHPEDAFEEQLRVRAHYAVWDDLDRVEDVLVEWAKSAGYRASDLPRFEGRLGDFLAGIRTLNALSAHRMSRGGHAT